MNIKRIRPPFGQNGAAHWLIVGFASLLILLAACATPSNDVPSAEQAPTVSSITLQPQQFATNSATSVPATLPPPPTATALAIQTRAAQATAAIEGQPVLDLILETWRDSAENYTVQHGLDFGNIRDDFRDDYTANCNVTYTQQRSFCAVKRRVVDSRGVTGYSYGLVRQNNQLYVDWPDQEWHIAGEDDPKLPGSDFGILRPDGILFNAINPALGATTVLPSGELQTLNFEVDANVVLPLILGAQGNQLLADAENLSSTGAVLYNTDTNLLRQLTLNLRFSVGENLFAVQLFQEYTAINENPTVPTLDIDG